MLCNLMASHSPTDGANANRRVQTNRSVLWTEKKDIRAIRVSEIEFRSTMRESNWKYHSTKISCEKINWKLGDSVDYFIITIISPFIVNSRHNSVKNGPIFMELSVCTLENRFETFTTEQNVDKIVSFRAIQHVSQATCTKWLQTCSLKLSLLKTTQLLTHNVLLIKLIFSYFSFLKIRFHSCVTEVSCFFFLFFCFFCPRNSEFVPSWSRKLKDDLHSNFQLW